MSSPLEIAAKRIQDERRLPDTRDWVVDRTGGLFRHWISIQNLGNATARFANLIINPNMDAAVYYRHVSEPRNRDASTFWRQVINVVPKQRPYRDTDWSVNYVGNGPMSLEQSGLWHPNVALQVGMAVIDRFDYSDKERGRQPSGQISLLASARAWGRQTQETPELLEATDTEIDTTDLGWERTGTLIQIKLEVGEVLTEERAETMLSVLADNVINHAAIIEGTYRY